MLGLRKRKERILILSFLFLELWLLPCPPRRISPKNETPCQSLLRVVRCVSRCCRCEVVRGSCYGRQWLFPLSSSSQYTGSTLSPMSLHLSAPCFRRIVRVSTHNNWSEQSRSKVMFKPRKIERGGRPVSAYFVSRYCASTSDAEGTSGVQCVLCAQSAVIKLRPAGKCRGKVPRR
jgi:hypothetical protein